MSEWFVPKYGSRNFRLSVGILFLPYTGMVVSFAIWGSLSVNFNLERIAAIIFLYFFAIGLGAHSLDAIGSKIKPWGIIPPKKLWALSIFSLIVAFTIGLYYAFLDSWLLFPVGILETFFLFAYNLELFKGKFHNNKIFVLSWGVLPVFAGSFIQTNSLSLETIILSVFAGLLSYLLIITSKKYKIQKRDHTNVKLFYKKEIILKILSIGVICGTLIFFAVRYLQGFE